MEMHFPTGFLPRSGQDGIRPSRWLKLISNADVHVFAASANRGTVFKYL